MLEPSFAKTIDGTCTIDSQHCKMQMDAAEQDGEVPHRCEGIQSYKWATMSV